MTSENFNFFFFISNLIFSIYHLIYANKTHANRVPNDSCFKEIIKFNLFLMAVVYISLTDMNPCSSNISLYTPHKLEHLMVIKCSLSTVQLLITKCLRKKNHKICQSTYTVMFYPRIT